MTVESPVFAAKNGFVHACLQAYNYHHHLVIRPEDVWFSIISKFSSYVNAHAEEFEDQFVEHGAHFHYEVELEGINHGEMAFYMSELVQEQVKDPGMRDWILPAFTTTTEVDKAVAGVIFLGTLQKYFTYSLGDPVWITVRNPSRRSRGLGDH